ncbi:tail protein D [Pseudomonas putida S11]|nr:tail protein D [Pseudomonas putida S11]
MKPAFQIIADGKDITALINDRLLLLRTSDKPGMESDEFELRIDDRDQAVTLPSRGAKIEVFLGYGAQAMARLGSYTVDEVEVTGPPDTITLRGKASDMRGSGKTTRSGSWEDVALARIVSDVAARNGWEPGCTVQTKVPRVDQRNESDFNFITRLAKQYDCTAKVTNGKLVVLPRQGGQSASGKPIGTVTISRADVSRYSFRLGDRSTQKAVKTQHQDKATGKLNVVELGNDNAPAGLPGVHTDRHIYPNKSAAEQAAKARLAAFNRSTAAVRLETGRAYRSVCRTDHQRPGLQERARWRVPGGQRRAGVYRLGLDHDRRVQRRQEGQSHRQRREEKRNQDAQDRGRRSRVSKHT